MKKLLESGGHTVTTCIDGREAIEAVKQQTFDLVFMDIEMPGMGGIESTKVIRSLGEKGAQLPIIATTGHADPEHRLNCLRGGMNDSISKPVDKAALGQAIAQWAPRRANPGR